MAIRLTSAEQVYAAFAVARRWSEQVLVEQFVPGILYRLLVVGDRLVAAVRRESAYVVGDGHHTIRELVDEANRDPRRGENYVSPLRQSEMASGDLPPVALGGLPNDMVPPKGQTVPLPGDAFLRSGGMQVDRTSDVHPEIVTLAVDTARIVGLDIAGLDVIAEDITRSPQQQSFAVLEVNPEPAIILHMAPLCEPPCPVADAIVESLFSAGQTGRVPLIAVLGSPSNMDVTWRVVTERRQQGETVGLASRDGTWLNGQPLGVSCDRVGEHTRRLWRHPRTDVVFVHLTLADILREGLPFPRCDQLIEIEPVCEPLAGMSEYSESDQCQALECLRATLRLPISRQ